jgi:hypothetical protein
MGDTPSPYARGKDGLSTAGLYIDGALNGTSFAYEVG